MKKLLLLFLFLASVLTVSAQDVIVKKDGATLLCKIIEIGTSDIKFKKWNNLDGPLYAIAKADIQAINYENGNKELFSEMESPQPQEQVGFDNLSTQIAQNTFAMNRAESEKLKSDAASWRTAGSWAFGIGLIGGIITGLIFDDTIGDSNLGFFEHSTYLTCCGIGIAAGIGSALFCSEMAKNKENASNAIIVSHIIKQDFDFGKSRLSAGINTINDKTMKNQTIGISLSLNF